MEDKSIAEKLKTLKDKVDGLKEEKIRLESELKTLKTNYDNDLNELLESMKVSSFEEAISTYKTRKEELDRDVESLSAEIDKYLDTVDSGEGNE